jgi:hypothetical protein
MLASARSRENVRPKLDLPAIEVIASFLAQQSLGFQWICPLRERRAREKKGLGVLLMLVRVIFRAGCR